MKKKFIVKKGKQKDGSYVDWTGNQKKTTITIIKADR